MTFKTPLLLKQRKSSLLTSCDLILCFELVPLYKILMFFYDKYLSITSMWQPFKISVKLWIKSCRELRFAT